MIEPARLLRDLKALLRPLEDDIRDHTEDVPELAARLKADYDEARKAKRTGVSFTEWRDDQVTQAAVAWILGCVFVRFIEDNRLLPDAWLAGSGERLAEAKDRHTLYFREHPRETDREYLLHIFENVRQLPAMAELLDTRHNPLWYLPPSGDGAESLRAFFQKIDAEQGGLVHDFQDSDWNTRFLGDLYQDLSEHARKKYALLQTPEFVEEFILDRTLEPAIDTFGLAEVRLIDLTCGSGHFVLGGFHRLLCYWQEREPGTNPRELVRRCLHAVYGVDLNPFSIAITRFRLLIAALKASDIHRLRDAPNYHFNLAVGDALLHGFQTQMLLGGGSELDDIGHVYRSEDAEILHKIFTQFYQVVVGNPPYILVKDNELNQAYRERYASCAGKYSLSVPFMERFFQMAVRGENGQPAGYVGQITANSFMKRQFGKKLIQEHLPRWDLTHVIDTSGCYIPGHGTPTVILFGRNQAPVKAFVRMVQGIKGEPELPTQPQMGKVWSSIVDMVDRPGDENEFISVADRERKVLHKHPWSIGGGGASELKVIIDESDGTLTLDDIVECISIGVVTAEDDAFAIGSSLFRKTKLNPPFRELVLGDLVRDWNEPNGILCTYPYNSQDASPTKPHDAVELLWPFKTNLKNRIWFRQTHESRGLYWWEYAFLSQNLALSKFTIPFAFVATHNHFVLDRGCKVFNRSAPVIKLDPNANEMDHMKMLGPLNSSAACFWMKQVFYPKGGDHMGTEGARVTTTLWEERFEFDGTKLKKFPLPSEYPLEITRRIDSLAHELGKQSPMRLAEENLLTAESLKLARAKAGAIRGRMIALQEELDWQCYRLYGLLEDDTQEWPEADLDALPPIALGERPFEILMARQMEAGELETTWFERHGSVPIVGIPEKFPSELRKLWDRRIKVIENDKNINLIERPEYKRRWNTESWDRQQARALEAWLQNRLEWVLSGRDLMAEARSTVEKPGRATRGPELLSCAALADRLRGDQVFLEVAALYRGRADFDLVKLVTELVESQGVPFLPVLRFKSSGLRKREAWEETWDLQRREDEIEREVRCQNAEVREEEMKELIREAQRKAVGEIAVPPKYAAKDFQKSVWWSLRGKLDVPKERYVLYPHCQREGDPTPVLSWAGWNHLEQAQALAGYYEQVRNEGWIDARRVPLLTGLLELLPWIQQWHNDIDPLYNERMGDFFAEFLTTETKAMNKTLDDIKGWMP